MAAIFGRTTKVKRYYWREIEFRTIERFENWLAQSGSDNELGNQHKRQEIEKEVTKEIHALHKANPKYTFQEESQETILKKYHVDVVAINGNHVPGEKSKRVEIISDGTRYSPEQFVEKYFEDRGFKTLMLESAPFHVLFGVLTWPLIQDPEDPRCQLVSFGRKNDIENTEQDSQVWTQLPEDFGTAGYFERRSVEIEKHFTNTLSARCDLEKLFNQWLTPSSDFRQYLWAHSRHHVDLAHEIIEILDPKIVISIIHYLLGDYWRRYLGWPDLLVYKGNQFFFAEVKSSKDKLSEDQKKWIQDNHNILRLPFKLIKIHKTPKKNPK